MAKAIDKQTVLDLIIEAKRADPDTGSSAEWLAEYLVDHLPTLTPPNEPLSPCDVCMYSPPSSCDGKPCSMCPAIRRPPEGDCEIKDYAETCEECRFCDNTPASPPEGEV